jgi:hypothetical protein
MKDDALGYNIEDTNIRNTREVTIKCNGKRFRILMELAKGCYGNCSGCSLSTIEKGAPAPLPFDKIETALGAFVPVIRAKNIRTTIVNYGVGDYFLYDANDLEQLSKITRLFFEQLQTQRNVISLSTSLLSRPEKMEEKAKAITKYLHRSQIVFDAVVDPERLNEHFDTYTKNLEGLTAVFPFFDVVVNVHKGMTPAQAESVLAFSRHAKVLNLDVQYALGKDNTYRVELTPEEFTPFYRVLERGFANRQEEEKLSLSLNEGLADTELGLTDLLSQLIDQSLQERVLVDVDSGHCFPVGFGFGDILLDERYYHPAIGTIVNGVYHPEQKAKIKMMRYLLERAENPVCQNCSKRVACYGTGYGYYQAFNTTTCVNPGRDVIFKS